MTKERVLTCAERRSLARLRKRVLSCDWASFCSLLLLLSGFCFAGGVVVLLAVTVVAVDVAVAISVMVASTMGTSIKVPPGVVGAEVKDGVPCFLAAGDDADATGSGTSKAAA